MLIVSVKHAQLLLSMRGVVEGVDVEREVSGRRVEGLDEQIHQHVTQPPEVWDRDGVLEPRERRLTGEVGIVGKSVGDELEDRIRSQRIVIVLILVIGEDAVDPLPDHAQQRLPREGRIAAIVESGRELFGESDVLVDLSHGQEAGIAGEWCGRDLDFDGSRRQKIV